MREVWPSLFTGDLKWASQPYPASLEPQHFVAHRDGVMVSYASVIRLTIEHGGEVLATAGLGNVLTSKPYRGQGFAGHLLDDVNAWMERGRFDVSCLFCAASLRDFYARHGWIYCPGGTLVGDARNNRPYPDSRMMRFLSPRGHDNRAALINETVIVAHPW
jgi:GNAT superfamily N-acetyltransferase